MVIDPSPDDLTLVARAVSVLPTTARDATAAWGSAVLDADPPVHEIAQLVVATMAERQGAPRLSGPIRPVR